MGFAKLDLLLDDLGGAQHHEQRVTEDFDLRALVRPKCVLDREVVQPELLLDDLQDIFARLMQPDPDEAARTFGERATLVDVEIGNAAAIFVSRAGHDHAHRGVLKFTRQVQRRYRPALQWERSMISSTWTSALRCRGFMKPAHRVVRSVDHRAERLDGRPRVAPQYVAEGRL